MWGVYDSCEKVHAALATWRGTYDQIDHEEYVRRFFELAPLIDPEIDATLIDRRMISSCLVDEQRAARAGHANYYESRIGIFIGYRALESLGLMLEHHLFWLKMHAVGESIYSLK